MYFIEFEKTSELLIRRGADVNISGNSGKTALMYAAEKGKTYFQTNCKILKSFTFKYTAVRI